MILIVEEIGCPDTKIVCLVTEPVVCIPIGESLLHRLCLVFYKNKLIDGSETPAPGNFITQVKFGIQRSDVMITGKQYIKSCRF